MHFSACKGTKKLRIKNAECWIILQIIPICMLFTLNFWPPNEMQTFVQHIRNAFALKQSDSKSAWQEGLKHTASVSMIRAFSAWEHFSVCRGRLACLSRFFSSRLVLTAFFWLCDTLYRKRRKRGLFLMGTKNQWLTTGMFATKC